VGIEVHGTIGVITLGYSRGLLDRDEAASLMRALQRETSLFVTDAVVERGIRMLDEQ
jgi:predicted nucleic acid-binding protein